MKFFFVVEVDGRETEYEFNNLADAQREAGRHAEGFNEYVSDITDENGNEYPVF